MGNRNVVGRSSPSLPPWSSVYARGREGVGGDIAAGGAGERAAEATDVAADAIEDEAIGRSSAHRCACCGTGIAFGGRQVAGRDFCSDRCARHAWAVHAAQHVSLDEARSLAARIHAGPCPHCRARAPVDLHVGHRIWSALAVSCWQSVSQVCCRACGRRHLRRSLLISALFGWWGPRGLLMTPVQLLRNLRALSLPLLRPSDAHAVSPRLVRHARMVLAVQRLGRADGGHAQGAAIDS